MICSSDTSRSREIKADQHPASCHQPSHGTARIARSFHHHDQRLALQVTQDAGHCRRAQLQKLGQFFRRHFKVATRCTLKSFQQCMLADDVLVWRGSRLRCNCDFENSVQGLGIRQEPRQNEAAQLRRRQPEQFESNSSLQVGRVARGAKNSSLFSHNTSSDWNPS